MSVVWSYLFYLALSTAITIGVARTLYKNGRVFLVDTFHGNSGLADSVNHLLVVGFYLINLGYVAVRLDQGVEPTTLLRAIVYLSNNVGPVLIVLGLMHLFNLYVFSRLRKRAMAQPQAAKKRLPAAGARS
jgi:hypothetical protein